MKRIALIILSLACMGLCQAAKYSFHFKRTNLGEALAAIAEADPAIRINFIYNELDNYVSSATIDTDSTYQALRQAIGLNPVAISSHGNQFFIEALQHGKYKYEGFVMDEDKEPVPGAAALVLSPRDSTVITYGMTDANGRFVIPCDRKNVIIKFSCVGYKTAYVSRPPFSMGTVTLHQAPIQLASVSVEAQSTALAADKNTYIPSSTQKNAAQNAGDLLRRMAIPQLVINPESNQVKDVFGNSVPVFINYQQAQPDQLQGMKMSDVRKIEYIEFSTDPRFKGEQRVVNIIIQEYAYGGYTKLTESFRTLNGIFNSSAIFSRLSYKRMTYELYAGSENRDFHHNGTDERATYSLQEAGAPVAVTRRETFDDSHARENDFPVTLRATYATPRFTARNAVSFTHFSAPVQNSGGNLSVDLQPQGSYNFERSNPSRNNAFSYHGNYWALAGQNVSIDLTPSFNHTHRDNISSYSSTLLDAPVFNAITENSYNWGVQANGRLALGQKHQLSLFIAGGQNINKLRYRGSNTADDSYSNSFMVGDLRYRYQTKAFSITPFAGLGFDHNSMNGINTHDLYPRLGLNTWISLTRKSQLSAFLSYQTATPDISMKANDIVRSNEFLYLTANPNLKNWRNLRTNLSFNWARSNSFSMAAFAGYEQDFNRVATIYVPYLDGTALLRDFINDGSHIHYYLGVSANWKLLHNSLQLYANLTQHAYDITGAYPGSLYPFRIQAQAVYYWKAFNILVSYGNPQRSLTENSNIRIRGRNFHMLSLGWGNGALAVSLAAKNIFNRGWLYETWSQDAPLYSCRRQLYNPAAHASLTLSVTYTIGYGKKIQRGNEAGAQTTTPSAIVK